MTTETYPFSLPPLPFAPDALEPHFDARTMSIHHDEHHRVYVERLNAALKDHRVCTEGPSRTCCET